MASLLKGKPIADKIKAEVKEFAEKNKLTIAIIQIGDDPSSTAYREFKVKQANKLGIIFEEYTFDKEVNETLCTLSISDVNETDITMLIDELNERKDINGIFVEQPIPKNFDTQNILSHISPLKDIDGIAELNAGRLYLNKEGLFPATAEAIMETLDFYNIDVKGKRVVIIGRSNVVGKPVAMMVLHKHGTVTICHSRTENLPQVASEADILIVAVGKAEMVTGDYIKEGAIVIDAGYNVVGGKSLGDVEFASAEKKASAITPVPGGIGTVTNAVIFKNLVKAYNLQNR